MRHRIRGRKLGRNASHRKAMFRNMAVSLIRSLQVDEDEPNRPANPGRVVTTLPKAKELRPFVEKLVTLGRKGAAIERDAEQYAAGAEKNTAEWKQWRESEQWSKWAQAIAPAVACRRRAFAILRDHDAVRILFSELAERFEERAGGYTRVVRLPEVRLGDAGRKAFIEFVGERDRINTTTRTRPAVAVEEEAAEEPAATDEVESGEAAADETAADETTASGDAAATGEKSGEPSDDRTES